MMVFPTIVVAVTTVGLLVTIRTPEPIPARQCRAEIARIISQMGKPPEFQVVERRCERARAGRPLPERRRRARGRRR